MVEPYVLNYIPKHIRSIFAQLRTGIHVFPLRIETGSFVNIMDSQTGILRKTTPIERICNICKMNFIEDENHFLFVCNKYDEERKILFEFCKQSNPNFANESETNKLIFLMSNEWKMFAVFVHELWQKRKQYLRCITHNSI